MDTQLDPSELIPHNAAARFVGVCPAVLHRWRAKGKVPAYRRGRRWFYNRDELLRVFERVEAPAQLPATRAELEQRAAAAMARMRAKGYRV